MSRKILLIDDSAAIRSAVSAALTEAGYEVVTAADGVEGLSQLECENPDLVIVDVEMPRLNGMSMVRAMKTSSKFQKLPVVLLTGRTDAKTAVDGINAGVRRIVNKPIVMSTLVAAVQTML